jgi:L-ascorbate metabolism protein UlaG (beta-lactamase superfamily)
MAKGTVRWLGHSMCEFITEQDKVILFDPWTRDDGNMAGVVDLADIERADLVVFSHDHFDHMTSAPAICKKNRRPNGRPGADPAPDYGRWISFGAGGELGTGIYARRRHPP